jgi:secondary thiamine-phosphate synthase enzyme
MLDLQAMGELVQASHALTVATRGKGFTEITRELARWLESIAGENGLLTVFVCHTSASLTIQENADPNVQRDLIDALEDLAPENRPYAHEEEGPDDMPSHIKAMLTAVSLSIPVKDGSMVLRPLAGRVSHRAPRGAASADRRVELHRPFRRRLNSVPSARILWSRPRARARCRARSWHGLRQGRP